jgi:3-oxoacyl-[acyl-carrier-protein] synthase II
MKSMTGHMLAASGAFETACAAMAIAQGMIFPTINLKEQDPNIPLTIATQAVPMDMRNALINSFGFGGVNAVLVLQRPDEAGG